jgi:CheY-like chemotaxis protein
LELKPVALILVIDDEAFYRSYIRRLLERMGHRVIEAADGAAGIALHRERHPDLTLVDFVLPDINGGKVMQSILRQDVAARFVAISSQAVASDPAFVATLKRLGAAAVVHKSDPMERMVAEIVRILA